MKRVVMAALLVAGAGFVGFNTPADAATNRAGTMVGSTPNAYAYGEGTCTTSSGKGDFTIEAGDTITWTNCSTAPHTVTGNGNSFGSTEQISPGASSPAYTFNTPGTFEYHCELHSSMKGKVTVTGEPPPATTTTQTTPTTQSTVATPTTRRATTTTTSTSTPAPTDTTADLGGVFGEESSTSSTTVGDTTDTTRALGAGGGNGTSAGLVAALIVGLGAVGTAAALLIRRMRAGPEAPL